MRKTIVAVAAGLLVIAAAPSAHAARSIIIQSPTEIYWTCHGVSLTTVEGTIQVATNLSTNANGTHAVSKSKPGDPLVAVSREGVRYDITGQTTEVTDTDFATGAVQVSTSGKWHVTDQATGALFGIFDVRDSAKLVGGTCNS